MKSNLELLKYGCTIKEKREKKKSIKWQLFPIPLDINSTFNQTRLSEVLSIGASR